MVGEDRQCATTGAERGSFDTDGGDVRGGIGEPYGASRGPASRAATTNVTSDCTCAATTPTPATATGITARRHVERS